MNSKYKCPVCHTVYSEEEYDKLERVPVNPKLPYIYGYDRVCSKCGARLWGDRWRIKDELKLNLSGYKVDVEVST